MTKFFEKSKKPYVGAILGHFCPKLDKKEFSWKKKALLTFKYSNYLPSCKKSEKANDPFLRKKCLTEGRTDR